MLRVDKRFLQKAESKHFRLCGPYGLSLNIDNVSMSGYDCVLILYFQAGRGSGVLTTILFHHSLPASTLRIYKSSMLFSNTTPGY